MNEIYHITLILDCHTRTKISVMLLYLILFAFYILLCNMFGSHIFSLVNVRKKQNLFPNFLNSCLGKELNKASCIHPPTSRDVCLIYSAMKISLLSSQQLSNSPCKFCYFHPLIIQSIFLAFHNVLSFPLWKNFNLEHFTIFSIRVSIILFKLLFFILHVSVKYLQKTLHDGNGFLYHSSVQNPQ